MYSTAGVRRKNCERLKIEPGGLNVRVSTERGWIKIEAPALPTLLLTALVLMAVAGTGTAPEASAADTPKRSDVPMTRTEEALARIDGKGSAAGFTELADGTILMAYEVAGRADRTSRDRRTAGSPGRSRWLIKPPTEHR